MESAHFFHTKVSDGKKKTNVFTIDAKKANSSILSLANTVRTWGLCGW